MHLASFFSAVFLPESQNLSFKILQGKKETKKNIHSCEYYFLNLETYRSAKDPNTDGLAGCGSTDQ